MVMHRKNPVDHQSVVNAMRHALRCVNACPWLMTRKWSKLYTGHALRVGGSNHIMRKLGIADDVHRCLGGWMTLQGLTLHCWGAKSWLTR